MNIRNEKKLKLLKAAATFFLLLFFTLMLVFGLGFFVKKSKVSVQTHSVADDSPDHQLHDIEVLNR